MVQTSKDGGKHHRADVLIFDFDTRKRILCGNQVFHSV